MHSLSIESLKKNYGGQTVLKDIDLTVKAGEFLILVGPSGCGKSTLLNSIAGLEQPSSGKIFIENEDITDLSPGKRDIAMVFQSYALYPNMNVEQNIAFGMEMKGIPKKERANKVKEVAATLQIQDLLHRKPAQLSGGQRQRVAMGRALARQPRVYLFDEPLSNLDARLRVDMRMEMKRLHQRMGTTIVYVTHDQIEAMTLGDRIAVMKDGIIQQLGTPQEIYDRPSNLFVASFMGSPTMNFLKGKVIKQNQGCGFQLNAQTTLPLPQECSKFIGKSPLLGIRPEQISQPDHRSAEANKICVTAPVEIAEPTGPDTLVTVSIADQLTTCRVSPQWALKHPKTMEIQLDLSRIVLFEPDQGQRCYP